MTKALLNIIVLIFFCSSTIAQTVIKDVDKLYQKYKNTDSINVTNAKVSVDFAVSLKLNANEKPESVILIGHTYQQSTWDVESLTKKLGSDKLKSRYKHSGSNTLTLYIDGYREDITVEVYTKGSQYAKYGISSRIPKNYFDSFNPYETDTEKERNEKIRLEDLIRSFKGYIVYLEVGDISRKSKGQSSDFNF